MLEFPNSDKMRYALPRRAAQLVDLTFTVPPDLDPNASFPRSLT
jgi:hypothetical protein